MINNKLTALWLRLVAGLQREEGQDALEYIIIAIIVVTIIYFAFQALGFSITAKIGQIISDLTSAS